MLYNLTASITAQGVVRVMPRGYADIFPKPGIRADDLRGEGKGGGDVEEEDRG